MLIFGLIIFVLAIWFITAYNGLVGAKNSVNNAWSQIDVQLKRRHDLIPNLVESVKGYMGHERETLEAVTKTRLRALQAESIEDKATAESLLASALGKLMAVAENYPQLKANETFVALQEELTSTENKIAFARQAYNDAVLLYNNKLQMVPSNIIAGLFNLTAGQYLEFTPSDRETPQVSFNANN